MKNDFIELKNGVSLWEKAIMNMRTDENGNKIMVGSQVQIGSDVSYIATCRQHYKEGNAFPFVEVADLPKISSTHTQAI